MRLPLAMLTLALAGCAVFGDGPMDGAPTAAPAAAADETVNGGTEGSANGAPARAGAGDASLAAAPRDGGAAPPQAGNGGDGAQIAVAPQAAAPATPPRVPPPRAGAAACAEVTANGPAREIDLDAVRTLMRGVDYRRGTFENNAAYRSRVVTRLDAVEALALERTGRAELVFSLPIPAYRLTYDADHQELSIGSDLGLLPGGSAIGMGDFILVRSNERQIGRHRSTIAYGARRGPGGQGVEREVTRVTGDQLGVIVPGGSSIGWPSSFERLRVPMPPADGQQARQSLAVLFVARLQEPYFATGEFIQEAKLDELVEKRLTVEAIRIAIECAAIYDRRSGRLIRQIVPAGRIEPRA